MSSVDKILKKHDPKSIRVSVCTCEECRRKAASDGLWLIYNPKGQITWADK